MFGVYTLQGIYLVAKEELVPNRTMLHGVSYDVMNKDKYFPECLFFV
jgi:hypothetical protein